MSKYYTPKIEEFVQGFEFEVKESGRFGILDINTGDFTNTSDWEYWKKVKVWWKDKNEPEVMQRWNAPFDVSTYLENNNIRAEKR